MNLQLDQIKSTVFGALRIYEKNGKIIFSRFTKKQEERFNQTLNYVNKPLKCQATSGMKFDFYTTSENVKLVAECSLATTRPYCYFDVYVDGEFFNHVGYDGDFTKTVTLDLTLKSGKKRVTIYLPNLYKAQFLSLEIDDGAVFEPYEHKRKFLFLGDSITQGYIAQYSSKSYANLVSKMFDAQVLNQAIGGAYFDADDFDEDICYEPDTVFIAYGTNDWAHGYDFERTSKELFDKVIARYKNSNIIYILPIWRGDTKIKEANAKMKFESMHEIMKNVCAQYPQMKVIDGMKLVPHDPKYFAQDILHPNDSGFCQYANNLYAMLKDYF